MIDGSGKIDVLNNGNIWVIEQSGKGDLRVGHIHSTGLCTGAAALCANPIAADVRLDSPRRILDAELDNGVLDTDDDGVLVDAYDLDISGNQNGVDVTGRNITLTAGDNGLGEAGSVSGTGGIGLPDNFLEIQVDAVGGFPAVAKGLLNAHDLAADDDKTLGIHLDQVAGDLRIGVVETAGDNSLSTGNVSLRSRAGSIIDGGANGAGDAAADVLGQTIDIDAHGGSIGTAAKDLDIDSLRGSPLACTNVNCANNTGLLNNGTSDAGLAATADDVALEAGTGIYLTETDAYLRLLLAHAVTGNIRITVRESAELDEDLFLIRNGTANFAEDNTTVPGNDADHLRSVPVGTVFAETGSVELRVGDDLTLHQNTQILANLSHRHPRRLRQRGHRRHPGRPGPGIRQQHDPARPHHRRLRRHRGRLHRRPHGQLRPQRRQPRRGPPDAHPGRLRRRPHPARRSLRTGPGADIQPGPEQGAAGRRRLHLPRLEDHGPRQRRPPLPTPPTARTASPSGTCSRWTSSPAPPACRPARGAGHTLTLDGQGETDHYSVYTNGSHGNIRNYVINVLDTGAPDDGVDELADLRLRQHRRRLQRLPARHHHQRGHGRHLPAAGPEVHRQREPVHAQRRRPRAAASAPPRRRTTRHSSPCWPAASPRTAASAPTATAIAGNEPSALVQRINYDTALNGRITVFGEGGNDAFYVDDTQRDHHPGRRRRQRRLPDRPDLRHPARRAERARRRRPPSGGHLPGAGADHARLAQPRRPRPAAGHRRHRQRPVHGLLEPGRDPAQRRRQQRHLHRPRLRHRRGLRHRRRQHRRLRPQRRHFVPAGGTFPTTAAFGTCVISGSYTRYDSNGDGVCNNADAHTTYNHLPGTNVDLDNTMWEDDIIPLDANGVAVPVIGLGFSTTRPLDIRAGGGEDEVQYNVNAPVNVDGGTGFDKLVILGTEFADDFAITDKGIFGAGLNVKYTTIEVVEVDGLEGDDQFFVQSTAYGVAYRMIGGLGSDMISVDRRRHRGHRHPRTRGPLRCRGPYRHLARRPRLRRPHRRRRALQPRHPGPRHRGDPRGHRRHARSAKARPARTSSGASRTTRCELAVAPTSNVYVTVSAAFPPSQEADGSLINPAPLPDGAAATPCGCASGPRTTQCDEFAEFQRHYVVNGAVVDESGRAVTLTLHERQLERSAARVPLGRGRPPRRGRPHRGPAALA